MTLWLGIPLGLLVVAMILLLSSSIDFRIRCYKHDKNDLLELDVKTLFGLIKLHYELPRLVFKGLEQGVIGKFKETGTATTGVDTVKEEHFDKERVEHWRENIQLAVRSTRGLKKWFKETVSHVKISKLDWSTDFSLGDAADTAIASGAAWGLKWSIVGFISQRVKLKHNPRVFVKPVFQDEPSFSMELVCEGKMSVSYTLYALLRLLLRVLRVSGGIGKWRKLLKRMRREPHGQSLE
ncbi:hypothetical protein CA600_10335 [Paenibacillus sp. VTT E-133280]|uniref:DUF2953 domain-containing protein n=1 Tax=unclassified Paenibacillus TaxID=185978 RepID=UPI000BA0EC88|nr:MULTISPECIES: DUF2953 domain-containing protein [unclassified Paenibacillus]OZQ66987.1 hypothetical protein CA600_10335 [Paenibacillus sp. VTT E-133280]OZQ94070.1 hypothetical protein CA598_09450 [Paenibacillus sp. VTT E-133291]